MIYLLVCLLVIVVATCVVLVGLGVIPLIMAIMVQLLAGVLTVSIVGWEYLR